MTELTKEELLAGKGMTNNPQQKPDGMCKWFAQCRNDATKVVWHPILHHVPCCDRCAKLAE